MCKKNFSYLNPWTNKENDDKKIGNQQILLNSCVCVCVWMREHGFSDRHTSSIIFSMHDRSSFFFHIQLINFLWGKFNPRANKSFDRISNTKKTTNYGFHYLQWINYWFYFCPCADVKIQHNIWSHRKYFKHIIRWAVQSPVVNVTNWGVRTKLKNCKWCWNCSSAAS